MKTVLCDLTSSCISVLRLCSGEIKNGKLELVFLTDVLLPSISPALTWGARNAMGRSGGKGNGLFIICTRSLCFLLSRMILLPRVPCHCCISKDVNYFTNRKHITHKLALQPMFVFLLKCRLLGGKDIVQGLRQTITESFTSLDE